VKVGIPSDAKTALRQLRDALLAEGLRPGVRASWMPDSARPQKRIDVGPASRPPADWWELRQVLQRDAIVAADIARSGYALVGQFPVYEPRTFMHSASFIAMGHALNRELTRSEEHTSELQSRGHLVCRLLLEKKKEYVTIR